MHPRIPQARRFTAALQVWSFLVIGEGRLGARSMARHSKLQLQVLSLYREFLRAAKEKPGFLPQIQAEFRKHAQVPRTDVMYIEYLLRRGRRQLEQLRDVHTKQMAVCFRSPITVLLLALVPPHNKD